MGVRARTLTLPPGHPCLWSREWERQETEAGPLEPQFRHLKYGCDPCPASPNGAEARVTGAKVGRAGTCPGTSGVQVGLIPAVLEAVPSLSLFPSAGPEVHAEVQVAHSWRAVGLRLKPWSD